MTNRRKRQTSLTRIFERSDRPLYMLDSQRNLVAANAAFGQWLGRPADPLIGQRCDYHSSPQVDSPRRLLGTLCPPPAKLGGAALQFVVGPLDGPATESPRQASAIWLHDDKGQAFLLVEVGDPVLVEPNADHRPDEAESLHVRLAEFRALQAARFRLDQLIGESAWMRQVREQVRLSVETKSRLLIIGPPGSGRQHLAKTIHYADTPESAAPLVPLDCPLLDPETLQATVVNVKKWLHHQPQTPAGWFLLLDVDQLSESAQHELLGLLEIPEFDLPTLATAEVPLSDLVRQRRFLPDLARYLTTMTIELPPLASRPTDIPLLAQAALEEANASGGHQRAGFTDEAMDLLVTYPWPGNWDELNEFVQAAHERSAQPLIGVQDLPDRVRYTDQADRFPLQPEEAIELDRFLADVENRLIRRAVAAAKGNKTRAAELLGITRARLHRKWESLDCPATGEHSDPHPDDNK